MIPWLTKHSSVSFCIGLWSDTKVIVTDQINNKKFDFSLHGEYGLHIQTLLTKLCYKVCVWNKDRKTQIWGFFLDRLREGKVNTFSYQYSN